MDAGSGAAVGVVVIPAGVSVKAALIIRAVVVYVW